MGHPLIRLILENAEEAFLNEIDSNQDVGGRAVLLCRFSRSGQRLKPDDILAAVKDVLADHDAELFFCRDHDVAITWKGQLAKTHNALKDTLQSHFGLLNSKATQLNFFQFYDSHANGEDLRLWFRSKLEQEQNKETVSLPDKTATEDSWEPVFSDEQHVVLARALQQKKSRKALEILIVEDQDFSRKLLSGLLGLQYHCYSAKDAQQAAQLFSEHAPDITFLDIELPDADGHALAAMFKRADPHCCIVMVTGNNHVKDIKMAKANNVQGFIVKPYNKQKIFGAVDAYIASRQG